MYSIELWELCFISPSPTFLLTFPWRSQKILVKLSKSNEHWLPRGTAPGGSKWMVPWSCVARSYHLTSKSLGKSKWQYRSADRPHSVQIWFLWIYMRKPVLFLLKPCLTFYLAGWFCKQKWNILSGIWFSLTPQNSKTHTFTKILCFSWQFSYLNKSSMNPSSFFLDIIGQIVCAPRAYLECHISE